MPPYVTLISVRRSQHHAGRKKKKTEQPSSGQQAPPRPFRPQAPVSVNFRGDRDLVKRTKINAARNARSICVRLRSRRQPNRKRNLKSPALKKQAVACNRFKSTGNLFWRYAYVSFIYTYVRRNKKSSFCIKKAGFI